MSASIALLCDIRKMRTSNIATALITALSLLTANAAKTHNDGDTCNRDQHYYTECSNDKSYVVTCQSDRHWRKSADCGAAGCTTGLWDAAFCSTGQISKDKRHEENAMLNTLTKRAAKTHNDMDTCNRDQKDYTECSNDYTYIVTCGKDRHWRKTTDCGAVKCSIGAFNTPICGTSDWAKEKRDEDAEYVTKTIVKKVKKRAPPTARPSAHEHEI